MGNSEVGAAAAGHRGAGSEWRMEQRQAGCMRRGQFPGCRQQRWQLAPACAAGGRPHNGRRLQNCSRFWRWLFAELLASQAECVTQRQAPSAVPACCVTSLRCGADARPSHPSCRPSRSHSFGRTPAVVLGLAVHTHLHRTYQHSHTHTHTCTRTCLTHSPLQVGHNALGAGQLIDQGAALVDKALASGSIFEGEGWKYISPAFEGHTLHFVGLLSDGGVHSRTDQLYGCLRGAAERGAKRIRWVAGCVFVCGGAGREGRAAVWLSAASLRVGSCYWQLLWGVTERCARHSAKPRAGRCSWVLPGGWRAQLQLGAASCACPRRRAHRPCGSLQNPLPFRLPTWRQAARASRVPKVRATGRSTAQCCRCRGDGRRLNAPCPAGCTCSPTAATWPTAPPSSLSRSWRACWRS